MKNSTFTHILPQKTLYPDPAVQTGIFRLLEVKEGETKTLNCLDSGHLICVETGEVDITCIMYGTVRCQQHKMILIPRTAALHVTGASVRSKVLVISCIEFSRACDCKLHLYRYIALKERTTHHFAPTIIKNALLTCVKSIILYIKHEVACERLYQLKLDEVAACIEHNYTPMEMTQLFYPIIARDSGFRDFIISSYSNQCTVAGLIEKSSLCKTVFYAKFHEEFGMTAKQWILKQKMKLIEDMLTDRRVRIKDIIIHFGFSSHEQFYTFCKRHFNCKPTELKMRASQLVNCEN